MPGLLVLVFAVLSGGCYLVSAVAAWLILRVSKRTVSRDVAGLALLTSLLAAVLWTWLWTQSALNWTQCWLLTLASPALFLLAPSRPPSIAVPERSSAVAEGYPDDDII